MMGKREEWTKLLFCFLLLASSYGVEKGHGLDARGCRILTNLCLRDKDCDRQVLYQRCRQHYVGHKARRTEDPVPPMSLVENWMFFPGNALGPEEKRKHGMRHIQSYPNYRKASEYSEDGENLQYHQRRQAVQRETGIEASENEAGHERSDYYDDDGYSDEDQRSSRGTETRLARGEAESRNAQDNYDAGDHHHGDPSYKIRLVRLAELNDDLDRVDRILADKGAVDMKILSRIKKEDQKPLYDLSQTNRENNLLLDEKQVADTKRQASADPDEKKFDDYLNFYASSSLQDAGLANSEKRRSSGEQEARPGVEIPVESAAADVNNNAKPQEKPRRAFDGDSRDVKASHFYPLQNSEKTVLSKEQKTETSKDRGTLILRTSKSVDPKTLKTLGGKLQQIIWGIDPSNQKIFNKVSIDPANDKIIDLRMQVSSNSFSSEFNPKLVANRINKDEALKKNISSAVGSIVLGAQSRRAGDRRGSPYSLPKDKNWNEFAIIIAIVGGCTLGLIVASVIICSLKRRSHRKKPIALHKKEAISDYEELCRTQMAVNSATSPRTMKAIKADRQRHGLIDGQGKITKKSWREEPLAYNMDITTGHVILSYMEDHLNDENKLSSEWEALCNYKADQNETAVGEDSKNASKNRYSNVLPYDHTRVKLRETANVFHSDYINASYITDADPRNPAYIATQGPLDNTVADFWQMIWEQGVVVIVNLTRLSDMGLPQCHRYWPEEGSDVYNTYQVHLISEHIWCDDYIVRSFYLKHLLTSETRTVTQFHFLTWPDLSVPESAKPILEFRRKVNKCYRGQACPIVVHCNNGVGRTGTYILIDMVLKKMIKGTKEIDIAATLEHLRDQRPDMVKTKAQFEFTLAAVAEEVTAILSSLSS